jgi:beta-lactamase regulating signal transducer with metallopeptidase domain/lipoprotein-anchoring transpeptidase ErfK/SrfK
MIAILNDIAQNWFDWQWAMLWQTTVLICIVALLDRLIRKWAWPQLRYALWLLVLVKLVLPPSLTSPVSLTSVIPAATQSAIDIKMQAPSKGNEGNSVAALPARPNTRSLPAEAVSMRPEASAIPRMTQSSEAVGIPGARPGPSVSSGPALRTVTPIFSWKAYLLGMWFLGVVGLCAGLLTRLKGLHAEYLRDATEPVPTWFIDLVKKTAQELHCRQVPTVVLSTRVCCPAVFGLLRPVLLVPADRIGSMTQQDARHILLHELAHIKRADLWGHSAYMALVILYWCNPLVWLIRKHIQNLRELCCDATVAKHLREDTPAYRGTLLETARDLVAQPVGPGLGMLGLFENSNWLVTRLQWLQKKTWRYPKTRLATIVLLGVIMLACILPMAQAQPPKFIIRGRVIDAQTGKPIAKARVGDANDYADGQFKTQTDPNGQYAYETWYEEHTVFAKARGYKPEEQVLITKPFGKEKEKLIDFELQPIEDSKTRLPESPPKDYDLLDNQKTGANPLVQIVQNGNLRRALEEELNKCIQTIDGVVRARVHVVTDEDDLPANQAQETTVSVVLETKPDYKLSISQVAAIKQLVASSAEGFGTEDVTVVDSEGRLLPGGSKQNDKRVLVLNKPKYEWWLKEPDKQVTVHQGDELEIEWKIDRALYDETDYFAVGVLGNDVDVSENHRYKWLAVDIPTTVRKTPYGKAWPPSYAVIGEMNKEARSLGPGSYRIVVCGFKEGGGDAGSGDWAFKLKGFLQCVATARLTVEPKLTQEFTSPIAPQTRAKSRDNPSKRLKDEKDEDHDAILAEQGRMALIFHETEEWRETYTVKPGDTLSKIGDVFKVPYQFLMQVNHIERASDIQVGQKLRVIQGPFHVKVRRSTKHMFLYLHDTCVVSFHVGLGQPGLEIPTGLWRITSEGKLIKPAWTDPQTGRRYGPDNPDYPLGDRWIGLEGVQGNAVGRRDCAIHGIKAGSNLSKQTSRGCIALKNIDVVQLYHMLVPEHSKVEVFD